jgi:hypothetical protein
MRKGMGPKALELKRSFTVGKHCGGYIQPAFGALGLQPINRGWRRSE